MQHIQIGGRRVSRDDSPYIIAEIGSNHGQDLGRAIEMIHAAAEAGADAAKFQSLRFDQVHRPASYGDDYKAFFDQIKLNEEWYGALAEACSSAGVHFLSSATYLEAVDLLVEAGSPAIKIASAQFDIFPEVVERAARTGLPLVMSCGLTNYAGIERMLRLVSDAGSDRVVLLHCITEYPAPADKLNLRMVETYRRAFGCLTGYSDHSMGNAACLGAVALGACVLEKHVTFDRGAEGPDHFFAATFGEFEELVRDVRSLHRSLGTGVKAPLDEGEREIRERFLYKWVTNRPLRRGEAVDRGALCLRRLPGGIERDAIEHLEHHMLRQDLPENTPLEWTHVEWKP